MHWPGAKPIRTATGTDIPLREGRSSEPDFAAQLRTVGRVAVFQPRPGLGDLIWHLPHIRAIAAATRHGRVTLITKPSTQADRLLGDDPAIERIVWFDRNPREGHGRHDGPLGFPRLVATLRACHAEAGVLLHHGTSLALAMWLAGMPNRYGYGRGWQRLWLNRPPFATAASPFTEAFDQATTYTDAAGLTGLPAPAIGVHPRARATVAARLRAWPAPAAALGIGCHGDTRQWGARAFAGLASALLGRGTGCVLLLAGRHEAALAEDIVARVSAPGRVHPVLGWDLPEVAALLESVSVFVGNDSGLMNLRAAVGQPAYGLFGASGPLHHSALIRGIVPPGGPRAGMDKISLQLVLDRLDAGSATGT